MKRKWIAFLLVMTMLLSLAACGGQNTGTRAVLARTPKRLPVQGGDNAGNGENSNGDTGNAHWQAADLPPYTIQWAYIGDSYDDLPAVQAEINKILEPQFNCTVNIIPMSWGEFANQLTLTLSGGEQLDLVPVLVGNWRHLTSTTAM